MKMKNKMIVLILSLTLVIVAVAASTQAMNAPMKATGGGWIVSPSSPTDKATFGFEVQGDGTTAWGNLQYVDHAIGMSVHGSVDTFSVDPNSNTATFSGTARINMVGFKITQMQPFAVTVVSGPLNTFTIGLPEMDYEASGTSSGGNIKISSPPVQT